MCSRSMVISEKSGEKMDNKPILTCAECGSGFFYQIERRMTGVVIDKGEILVQEPLKEKTATFFVCQRCGCIVPLDKLKDFQFSPQLQPISKN